MPPILMQKSSVVSLLILLVGLYFHYHGTKLDSGSNALLSQGLGLLFDIVAANVTWFTMQHQKNKAKIDSTIVAVNSNADTLDAATSPSVTVAKVDPKGAS